MQKKYTLLAVSCLFFVLAIIVAVYFYNDQKIKILNESKYYLATFENREVLNKYLGEWEVWKEKKVNFDHIRKPFYTVKRIRIHSTDNANDRYMLVNNASSVKGAVDNNGTYDIFIYLHPTLLKKSTDEITKEFNYSLLDILYGSTHSSTARISQVQVAQKTTTELSSPQKYPVTVTRKK